jgi:hypothetical protein
MGKQVSQSKKLIAQVRDSKIPYRWLENVVRVHEPKNASSRIVFSAQEINVSQLPV